MTRVLYLSPYFWPEEIGSAPYSSELAFHLAAKGHDVQAVTFRPHYPSIAPFEAWADGKRDQEQHAAVNISRVPVNDRGSGGFKDRIRNDLRFLRKIIGDALRGRFKRTDSIVAYVPSVLTLYGAKIASWITGAPILAIVHDIESGLAGALGITRSGMMLVAMQFVERIGLNFADRVVVLTEGMAEELRRIGCRRPIDVISIWGSAAPEVPIDASARPVLLYSGNFGKKQNIDQLLPLLDRLSREDVPVDVIMRGGGSERERIAGEIASRGIGNVQFLPLVPADEFMSALQGANIHLVPQAMNVANYALPSKLFSIMSAGRPFICIAQPESPLDNLARSSGAGLCIPPGDDDALYTAVSQLLADTPRQIEMGRNGQNFIRIHMDRESILSAFEKLIVPQAHDGMKRR